MLRQKTGAKSFPFHATYFTSMEIVTQRNEISNFEFSHRLSYVHQILVARKLTNRISLQLSPTFIHRNLVANPDISNDLWAVGIGGRYNITTNLSINIESFYIDHGETPEGIEYYIPLSIGIDLDTGVHVFQIMVTNSLPMREVGFITETQGDWFNGDLRLGFNISRTFNLVNY